jgi:hypothetical protein
MTCGVFDDFTPREVWAAYEAKKRSLEGREDYAEALEEVLVELGIGLPEASLTDAQRRAQMCAVARFRGDR